jgi:putative nucleotidyltransferase with HDIG domain
MPFEMKKKLRIVSSEELSLPQPELLESKRAEEAMESLYNHPHIQVLLRQMWLKDPYTYTHSHRVADFAQWIGKDLGLSHQERVELYLTGLLHDIGKLFTPDEVLKKPQRLSQNEFLVMKKHPEDSAKILHQIRDLRHLEAGVLSHHERFDGTGYPNNLKGEAIPLFARIIFVADTFDAMTTSRVYREKLDLEKTYQELIDCSGTQFDPSVAKAFVTAHKRLMDLVSSRKKAA